jgi:mannose-6-phosphate isomerase-like protein (cupin superfamily)
MRVIGITLAVTLFATAAMAQQGAASSAQAVKMFSSSADVVALQAKAKTDRKGDAPLVVERILQLAPYNANLEYRASIGPASVHEKEAELFYVIDGGGTMVTGGKLTKESRTNAENLTGSGIEGGTPRKLAKGDFLIVPENTPHWFSSLDGSITLMSLHIPRSGGGTR